MNRFFFACVFGLAGILVSGCGANSISPTQKATANKQWNDARAGVLASLAVDQYKTGNLDKCQEALDEALGLEPENAALHVLAAKLAIEQGKLELAQSHLTLAGKFDARNAEIDYLSGVILQRWQLVDKARDAYAAAVVKNPLELSYLLAEAEMMVALNQPSQALALLQSKEATFEHSGAIRDEIGQLLMEHKRYPEAVEALRQASMLANDDPTIREHLAFALLADHQYTEAGDRLARLTKEAGYEKRADLFAALAECEGQANQLSLARKDFETATQCNPVCGGYWLGLAKVAVQQKELVAAELAVHKALSVDPDSGESQCLLGYIKLQQNQLIASLAAFQAAAELDPTDSTSVSLQGYVLARMGKAADAKPLYAKALKINPNDELAGRLMVRTDLHD